jgi:hypothetical protein
MDRIFDGVIFGDGAFVDETVQIGARLNRAAYVWREQR